MIISGEVEHSQIKFIIMCLLGYEIYIPLCLISQLGVALLDKKYKRYRRCCS